MRLHMSSSLVLPLVVLAGFAACAGKGHDDLGGGSEQDGGGTPSMPSVDDSGQPILGTAPGVFSGGSDGGVQATDCKGGHYSGSFTGNYTSYLTSLFGLGGFPLKVTGNVELDLNETMKTTRGEIQMTTFDIANGTISGFANNVFPYHCDMVGSLDCNTKQLVNGGLRNCWYCVGLFVQTDGGGCSAYGHFEGPLNAGYDGKKSAFVNGTWNGSEQILDGGVIPDGGGVNDAGLYVGPGNYGGSGMWGATSTADF